MNKIHSKNIKVSGLNIHYLTGGQGSPLIIVHGGGEGSAGWAKPMAELTKKYRIYAPDLPGWGNSEAIAGDYYIPELVEFLDNFAHSLGLQSFYLMGHSLGGGIALNYALKFPNKVDKLILVSSLCLGKEIALWVRFLSSLRIENTLGKAAHAILRGVKWFVDSTLAPMFQIEFVNPICAASLTLGRKVVTFRQQTMVLADRLSEIAMPTLVVWGAKDPVVPFRQAYMAAELIPDCQVKVFADCGHSVYRERIPEFSGLVGGFLG